MLSGRSCTHSSASTRKIPLARFRWLHWNGAKARSLDHQLEHTTRMLNSSALKLMWSRDISPTSTQKPGFAVPAILEPYLCRENCSPFHTKSCLLCLSYLYSRPTFPGNGANLCGDTLTVSLHHVKSVVRTF